ncbi:DUF3800 domain-containing protein [Leucothrix pacifica]|uniref:DUF3800 domain-containing protein n=1 Tax=Leucothrix pacifica TaxID=1247513 RepID=A0A317C021_9GAMM|nr:DUF3800 domain-containing protein [Leucothrix pacifica]PWQ92005.1 hypothetical protein DKW60_23420 [Leucothrix pacifica]
MDQPSLDNSIKNYTFYYDESNNVRKLTLLDGKYNIDNHQSKVSSSNFVLAGIVKNNNSNDHSFDDLFSELNIQKTAKELKFNQVAKGEFEDVLKSRKLMILLRWLLNSNYNIHYFNLNMEYWVFLDLIEDLVLHVSKERIISDEILDSRQFHYKDALYCLLKLRKEAFLNIANRYGYPKISKAYAKKFISEISSLAKETTLPNNRFRYDVSTVSSMKIKSLHKFLRLCKGVDDLTLTYNHERGVLIDGLSFFYSDRLRKFNHSIHIFDNEYDIEREIKDISIWDDTVRNSTFKFVESIEHKKIQVSDVVAGLFMRYFTFLNKYELAETLNIKGGFNSTQAENINLMKSLIYKSAAECEQFLFYSMSVSESDNHNAFLFDR